MTSADPQEQSDEALAARSRTGCSESFELLVTRFEVRIYNFLCRLVGNAHDAEDLTQVAFVKAWRNIHSYQSPGVFSAWLFTIAKRTALNHFRAHHPTEPLPEEDGAPGGAVDFNDPAVAMAEKDDSGAIWKVARRLKPEQHEVLWLRYGEGFSIAETAQIMQTNQIRVRVLLHRARGGMVKLLGGKYEA